MYGSTAQAHRPQHSCSIATTHNKMSFVTCNRPQQPNAQRTVDGHTYKGAQGYFLVHLAVTTLYTVHHLSPPSIPHKTEEGITCWVEGGLPAGFIVRRKACLPPPYAPAPLLPFPLFPVETGTWMTGPALSRPINRNAWKGAREG